MKNSSTKRPSFHIARVMMPAIFSVIAFLGLSNTAHAANCGDTNGDGTTDTVCVCGGTVVGAASYTYQLPGDLGPCTSDGLIVGASGVTIDGASHTITGPGLSTYYGVNNSISPYYNNIVIKNLTVTNFYSGIYFRHGTGSTINNVTANSNQIGIYIASGSNILTGNTANSNSQYGIYIGSGSNTLTNNTANLNSQYGIDLDGSSSNTLTGNAMSGNSGGNLNISGSFNNTVDTTNTVEGKPVYYLYEDPTTHLAMDGITTYDGNVYNNPVGGIGMFWCINCTNVTIKNVTLSANNYYGVYFNNTTGSTINNVTANSNSSTYFVATSDSNAGIYLTSSNTNTLTNNTANSNNYGIRIDSSGSNILTGNTTNLNSNAGIYLISSNTNTLTNNTANSNNLGIYLNYTSSLNTLTGNTANSNNNYGIYIASSGSNTLTGNIILNNANDLQDTGTINIYSLNHFLHNSTSKMLAYTEATRTKNINDAINFNVSMFDPRGYICPNSPPQGTGLIAGYALNNAGSGYSIGDSVSVGGGNATLSVTAVIAVGVITSQNINNNGSGYQEGDMLSAVGGNGGSDFTVDSVNENGEIQAITMNSGGSGYTTGTNISLVDVYSDGEGATINITAVSPGVAGVIKGLSISSAGSGYSVQNGVALAGGHGSGATINITSISVLSCSYTITTSPLETITAIAIGNQVTGSFIATKSGTYSLIFTVADSNGNTTERRMVFLVGNTNTQTTTYYLRGIVPTHGQPAGSDSKSLSLTVPTSTETWKCGVWIQNSSDAEPTYPLSNLSGINVYSWYEQSRASGAYIGAQRYVTYNATVDSSDSVPVASSFTWVHTPFANLNWAMDYPQSWYWLSLKLYGSSPYWQTTAAQPSYANFTYSYATTPAVKSVSNDNVVLLSATASSTDIGLASLALENDNPSATSTDVVLTGFDRPFLGATSTIDYTGTTTVTSTVAANATSSIDSVPMDITPSAGSIQVFINTWDTSGTYHKNWTETGDTVAHNANATAVHVIGDLKPDTLYTVMVNGSAFNTYQSNSSGQITFTYNGGYSTDTFEVGEDTTTSTATTVPAVTTSYSSSGGSVSPAVLATLLAPGPATTAYLNSLKVPSGTPGSSYAVAAPVHPASAPMTTAFDRSLRLGMSGNDVKRLQIFLNAQGFIVAKNGVGSTGHETTYFGSLTKAALMKFQLAYKKETLDPQGLTSPTGFFGRDTMKLINGMLR